nr:MAG TPA: hypothetical protein [Caudoviricetes sp.]
MKSIRNQNFKEFDSVNTGWLESIFLISYRSGSER